MTQKIINMARFELVKSCRQNATVTHVRLLESGFVIRTGLWRDMGALLCNRNRFPVMPKTVKGSAPTCKNCARYVKDYNIKKAKV